MAKTKNFIEDKIGETLLITLYMKHKESQKKNPIIIDTTASELVSKINYDFTKFDKATNSSVGVAIRANYFDEVTQQFIQNNNNPVIVQIGCGLDSRYTRIGKIAEKGFFYQLDIPEVMKLREKLIPKHKNETYIHSSMLEIDWMDMLKQQHPNANFLFIIEGIFMYFTEKDVQKIFIELAKRFSKSELLFDIINVWMSKNSHIHDSVKVTRSKFIFGTDDDKLMEAWAKNLKHTSTKLFLDFKTWKRAGIKGWVMRFIPKFKTSGRMLHYKIN